MDLAPERDVVPDRDLRANKQLRHQPPAKIYAVPNGWPVRKLASANRTKR